MQGCAPLYLRELLVKQANTRTLRSNTKNLLKIPLTKLKRFGDRAFCAYAPRLSNELPDNIKAADSVHNFKKQLKTLLFRKEFNWLYRRVAKCQNYTFDGVFRYKSSSMLIHLYIGWALAYGWMTFWWILGHFMQKISKKACFLGFPSRKFIFWDRNSKLATNVFKRMLLIIEHVTLVWLQWTPCCEWFWGKIHQKWVIFVISHNLNVTLWTIPNSQLNSLV